MSLERDELKSIPNAINTLFAGRSWEMLAFLMYFEASLDLGNSKNVKFCVDVIRVHLGGREMGMSKLEGRNKRKRKNESSVDTLGACLEAARGLGYEVRACMS